MRGLKVVVFNEPCMFDVDLISQLTIHLYSKCYSRQNIPCLPNVYSKQKVT